MKDVYIPSTLKRIREEAFGNIEGLCVHTPSGSAAEAYMKKCNGIQVINDYFD